MRLITLAIHTYDKACALKALLEREGMQGVTLQNVNLSDPVVAAGVRVRIHESDLPLALRIIENPDIFTTDSPSEGMADNSSAHSILVPVDFSPRSMQSLRMAFAIASTSRSNIVILHAFLTPQRGIVQLSPQLSFDSASEVEEEVADEQTSVALAREADRQMKALAGQLRAQVKSGELPGVKFSTVINEGVPEECIERYVKEHSSEVRLIVMTSRAAAKKNVDLQGSITAEVLERCRMQLLALPENGTMTDLSTVRKISLLSTLEQEDFLALDALGRLLPADHAVNVRVMCLPNKKYSKATNDAAPRGRRR